MAKSIISASKKSVLTNFLKHEYFLFLDIEPNGKNVLTFIQAIGQRSMKLKRAIDLFNMLFINVLL
ncbi:hypothetical protein HYN46_12290 [Aquirhabdus parva]|uniref:Uncharacterized protein n=1 Tax=Aquirhabdus parva TaxID=2283318 RepID=A0A345P8D6_9GAMM|nr:hypothetical protein HYN46_12290 [Aquirhabdus parva]